MPRSCSRVPGRCNGVARPCIRIAAILGGTRGVVCRNDGGRARNDAGRPRERRSSLPRTPQAVAANHGAVAANDAGRARNDGRRCRERRRPLRPTMGRCGQRRRPLPGTTGAVAANDAGRWPERRRSLPGTAPVVAANDARSGSECRGAWVQEPRRSSESVRLGVAWTGAGKKNQNRRRDGKSLESRAPVPGEGDEKPGSKPARRSSSKPGGFSALPVVPLGTTGWLGPNRNSIRRKPHHRARRRRVLERYPRPRPVDEPLSDAQTRVTLDAVIRAHRWQLVSTARHHLGNRRQDAEDLVQDSASRLSKNSALCPQSHRSGS